MALAERSAAGIFTCESHGATVEKERANRKSLTGGPVDFSIFFEELLTTLELLCEFRVWREPFGVVGQAVEHPVEHWPINSGWDRRKDPNRVRWWWRFKRFGGF